MPRVTVDGIEVEVREGGTVLDAARRAGIEIPTLCHLDGHPSSTSCLVCLVRVSGSARLVPSCATRAIDGMRVENDTEEIRLARRAALELLLSDHAGDCAAPCQNICPAHMDVPLMIREIANGRLDLAISTVKTHIALPAILGRVCPKPCEKGCRRSGHDGAVAVCLLKQSVADEDLATGSPWLPRALPPTGKRVAIVGAGPAGLAAAWHLLAEGYGVTVLDDRQLPGGMLRYGVEEARLPRTVLDGEIDVIRRFGAELRGGVRVGEHVALDALRADFDAVLIAAGELDLAAAALLGFPGASRGIDVDPATFETRIQMVFAAGGAVRKSRLAVRSVAEGRSAAMSMARALAGRPAAAREPYRHRLVQVTPLEVTRMAAGAGAERRVAPAAGAVTGFSAEEARLEATRCLRCDCSRAGDCKLQRYASLYGADPNRFRGERRQIEIHHREGGIIYEPGKCILCGLCVEIAAAAREPLGLAFVGRGFNVRVGVPFNGTIAEGLRTAGKACVTACPTGALAFALDPRGR